MWNLPSSNFICLELAKKKKLCAHLRSWSATNEVEVNRVAFLLLMNACNEVLPQTGVPLKRKHA